MRVWQVYRENRENAVLLPLSFIYTTTESKYMLLNLL
jgi:hypothetical protein